MAERHHKPVDASNIVAVMHSGNGVKEVDLGIVVPAHNEEQNLPILIRELAHAFRDSGVRYEVVLVNDGSRRGWQASIVPASAARRSVFGVIFRSFAASLRLSQGSTPSSAGLKTGMR